VIKEFIFPGNDHISAGKSPIKWLFPHILYFSISIFHFASPPLPLRPEKELLVASRWLLVKPSA